MQRLGDGLKASEQIKWIFRISVVFIGWNLYFWLMEGGIISGDDVFHRDVQGNYIVPWIHLLMRMKNSSLVIISFLLLLREGQNQR